MRRSSSSFKRLDLAGDVRRLEIVHALEVQVDAEFARIGSSLNLFSTVKARCGFMLASTLSKLSSVISTNLRSFRRARGSSAGR